jgi:hypothetical protein
MKSTGIHAVAVGISQYARLRKLSGAANDAHDLAEVLREGASSAQIKLLIDADATKHAILREIAWLARNASPGDTAIVFFSGHGGRYLAQGNSQAYFCPTDASTAVVEKTCIASSELTMALRGIRSERLVVLVDTCYSGGIGEPRRVGVGLKPIIINQDLTGLIEGRGRVIIAASRPDEAAWELNGMRNGLFTTYLLRALRGEVVRADGTVWMSDVFSYVTRGVRQHRCQHPYQKVIGEDFVLMVHHNAQKPSGPSPSFGLSSIDQRSLRIAMRRAYNRAELSLLCQDLGLTLDDLPGLTLETQLMDLIDHCHRHGLYDQLLGRLRADRPQLIYIPNQPSQGNDCHKSSQSSLGLTEPNEQIEAGL